MSIITGYLSADCGTVSIDGVDILEEPQAVKQTLGYLPETPPLYTDMTVREYLTFACRIKQVPKKQIPDRIQMGLDAVKIDDVADRLIGNLSKGYRQRVGLAQALMGNPDLLILDEPTAGLDPKQIIEIRSLIRELGKDRTVILSSHILPEVSEICRRVIIMNDGRIVADGNPSTIGSDLFDATEIIVTAAADEKAAVDVAEHIEGITEVTVLSPPEPEVTELMLQSAQGKDLRRAIFEAYAGRSVPLLGLRVKNATLEEIFLELTSGSAEAATAVQPAAQPQLSDATDPVGPTDPSQPTEQGDIQ